MGKSVFCGSTAECNTSGIKKAKVVLLGRYYGRRYYGSRYYGCSRMNKRDKRLKTWN